MRHPAGLVGRDPVVTPPAGFSCHGTVWTTGWTCSQWGQYRSVRFISFVTVVFPGERAAASTADRPPAERATTPFLTVLVRGWTSRLSPVDHNVNAGQNKGLRAQGGRHPEAVSGTLPTSVSSPVRLREPVGRSFRSGRGALHSERRTPRSRTRCPSAQNRGVFRSERRTRPTTVPVNAYNDTPTRPTA